MLEVLLGGGLGGLFRLLPEGLKLINGYLDRKHEKEMFALQIERDKATTENKLREIGAQGDATFDEKSTDALIEAIRAQSTPTGNAIIDFISSTVRPVLTYWWMTLFTLFKVAVFLQMWNTQGSWTDAITYVWTASEMGVLTGIINFWFLDRVIRMRR